MKKVKNKLLNVTAPLAAIVAISISYSESRCPCLSQKDCMILAANFKFERLPLPEVANHPPYKYVRAGSSESEAHFRVDFLARAPRGRWRTSTATDCRTI